MFSYSRLLILFVLFLQNVFSEELIKSYLKNINEKDAMVLEYYFREMLQGNDGYVLYGDKPMSIGGVYVNNSIKLSLSEWESVQHRAYQILKEWNQPSVDRNYIVIFTGSGDQLQRILINKKSFLKVVNDNLTLFRYIIDPRLTSESLLSEMIENQNRFEEIIKNNSALMGILLGYGTNNSIAYSRYELISNLKDSDIEFPYIDNNRKKNRPLAGFETLETELKSCRSTVSTDIKDLWPHPIPYFGCDPSSDETRDLIKTYEKNRENIIAAAKQENLLEAILEKFFSTTSNVLRLPQKFKRENSFNLDDKKDIAQKLAEIVLSDTEIKDLNQNYLIDMFLKGMSDFEKDIKPSFRTVCHAEAPLIEREMQDCMNLEMANQLFTKLSNTKNWVSLIEENILYKVVKKGAGCPMSSKVDLVTFHYSLRSPEGEDILKSGTVNETALNDLIPGIAHCLIGMKKGEQRGVYIHPRYAYGDQSPYSNQPFLANIHLVSFKEGEKEVAIQKPRSLDSTVHRITSWGDGESTGYLITQEKKENSKPLLQDVPNPGTEWIRNKLTGSYQEILAQYEKIQGECFYFHGRSLRKYLKVNDIDFKFDEFKTMVNSKITKPKLKTNDDQAAFIVDLKLHGFDLL